jgi:signal transduction histidine kinase/CheY-like chemotaxis protein
MSVRAEAAAEIRVVARRALELPAARGLRLRARLSDPRLAAPVIGAVVLAIVALIELSLRAGATQGSQSGPEIQAAAVSGAIVLVLLAGFVVLLDRALVADELTQWLADRLGESEQHRADGQRLAGVGSWEWDFRTRTCLCSEEQLRLHGWDDPQALTTAEALLAAIDQADRERVRREVVRPFGSGETLSLDYHVPHPGGKRLIHLEARVFDRTPGFPSGLVGTCQDISERLRRIEAERSNRAKSEFMSRMSHELRTPLNAILGFAQLLSLGAVDERRRESNVKRILDAGQHLLGLINELLEISRLDTGVLELSMEQSSLQALLAEAIDRVRPEAESRGIEVRADLGVEEVWAEVDPGRLKQVAVRLLSNAVKYNHDGGNVRLRLTARGSKTTIVVSDDGPGIPAAKFGQLFQPFERLGAEQTGIQGSGLGLALSSGVVEAMGGTIELDSDERGTTVTISLARQDPAGPGPGRAPPASSGAGRRPVVLCIDDNPSNLILIEQILATRPKVELRSTERGLQGLEMASSESPALILLDLNLPDIDGGDLLERLKLDAAVREIPVVILSADAAPEQRSALIAAGAAAYLTKPIDVAELLALIDQTLAIEPTEPP